ncbi:glutathione S-transferase family protein [Roseibium aggregatum]|uniref:Glutathione S-transferase n=1 Tax=Roseibium aggregatum TaxID=187304 RepID=A0A939J503_9HYPH|nr:glutathione S-transferase [Roseibium aggregatum]MBN9671234.1 glutathione S-transferase [Roseibium aggregatum]
MSKTIKIHRFPLSGHCHRVELFSSLTGLDYELVEVDLRAGEHKRDPFLKLNPQGRVPVIEDGATVLADSHAILVYLAKKYAPDWLPSDPFQEAEVHRFLAFAAGELANGPGAARLINVFGSPLDPERAKTVAKTAFDYLETYLDGRAWLVGDRPTIADVALYSYTAHAPEGNVSLDPYPNIRALLARIEALPGFVAMPATKAGLAA